MTSSSAGKTATQKMLVCRKERAKMPLTNSSALREDGLAINDDSVRSKNVTSTDAVDKTSV